MDYVSRCVFLARRRQWPLLFTRKNLRDPESHAGKYLRVRGRRYGFGPICRRDHTERPIIGQRVVAKQFLGKTCRLLSAGSFEGHRETSSANLLARFGRILLRLPRDFE
jgi:hypothetical protein